jgi:hypothetical protein
MALETAAKLRDLQRISTHVPSTLAFVRIVNEGTIRELEQAHTLWSDSDPLEAGPILGATFGPCEEVMLSTWPRR